MPYERDADHVTRGVGAIAAMDHVSPARHRRRVQVGRALRRRDRAMSAIAQGALGMVIAGDSPSTTSPYKPTLRVPIRVPIKIATAIAKPVAALPPVYVPPPSATPIPAPAPTASPTSAPATPAPAPVAIKVPTVTVGGGGGIAIAPAIMPTISTTAPSLTEIPDASVDHTTRNVVLLAAGAGALAYFLFFRRRT